MIKSEGPQDFDPLAPETFDSPYDVDRDLRQRCPVAHSQAWNDITSVQNVVPKLAFTGRRPPLHLDPPEHTPYRRALYPLFRTQRMEALEPVIRQHAVTLLQPLLDRGTGDICEDFTSHLSLYVFASWMNMPEHMLSDLRSIGRAYNVAVQSFEGELVKETSLKLSAEGASSAPCGGGSHNGRAEGCLLVDATQCIDGVAYRGFICTSYPDIGPFAHGHCTEGGSGCPPEPEPCNA